MMIKFYNFEVFPFLKQIGDKTINIIITSPPYNLQNKGGDVKIDSYADAVKEQDYAQQQRLFLNECARILKNPGALFYFHKNRYSKNKVISPYEWVLKSKLNLKQEIIWDRLTTVDRELSKFAPMEEKIFWLYNQQTFRLKSGAQNYTNIWRIPRTKVKENRGHKATFPYEIIFRIINSLDLPEKVLVLDPYCGTGTVGQVCNYFGLDCILNDYSPKWIEIAKEKVNEPYDFVEEIPVVKNKYKK